VHGSGRVSFVRSNFKPSFLALKNTPGDSQTKKFVKQVGIDGYSVVQEFSISDQQRGVPTGSRFCLSHNNRFPAVHKPAVGYNDV